MDPMYGLLPAQYSASKMCCHLIKEGRETVSEVSFSAVSFARLNARRTLLYAYAYKY